MSGQGGKTKSLRKGRRKMRRRGTAAGSLRTVGAKAGRSLFSNFGFPDRARVRLAYGQSFTFTASTVTGGQIFRGNSVFDPDYTGGGNQPADYDLYAAVYFRYRVHASYIRVTSSTAATAQSMKMYILPTNNTTTVIDMADALCNARVKSWTVNGGVGQMEYTHQAKTSTIHGSQGLLTDIEQALTGANPSEGWYWHVGFRPTDGSTSITAYADIQVVYDVEFFERALADTDLAQRMIDNRAAYMKYLAAKPRTSVRAADEKKRVLVDATQVATEQKGERKSTAETKISDAPAKSRGTSVVLSGDQLEDYRDWAYVSDDPDTWSEYAQAEAFFKKAASLKQKLDNAVGTSAGPSLGGTPSKPAAKPG